jgi:hypothetical protein
VVACGFLGEAALDVRSLAVKRREMSQCRLLIEWVAYVVRSGENLNG